MKEFWYQAPLLAVIAVVAFCLWGFGYIMLSEMEQKNVRYEQCVAADKQWVKGSCVK